MRSLWGQMKSAMSKCSLWKVLIGILTVHLIVRFITGKDIFLKNIIERKTLFQLSSRNTSGFKNGTNSSNTIRHSKENNLTLDVTSEAKYSTNDSTDKQKEPNTKHNQELPNTNHPYNIKPKRIILWNDFLASYPEGWNQVFKRQLQGDCPENCDVTRSKSNWQNADVIIFKQPLDAQSSKRIKLPPTKLKNQTWLIFSAEAPTHKTWNLPMEWLGIFDWTFTYHTKSDVVMPYGTITPIQAKTNAKSDRDYWAEKRDNGKFAAWMISHCPTSSGREEYVRELRKYENVDIYGECGDLHCGNRKTLKVVREQKVPDNCYELMATYKFYFAFENSICEDYITEKFFKTLQMDTIPVVFGGGNYSAIAPPHSFINGTAFEKPKDLATYLRTVANNQSLYNSFFDWKGKYRVEVGFPFNPMICDLCHQLHNRPPATANGSYASLKNAVSKDGNGRYKNVVRWFYNVSRCRRWNSTTQTFTSDVYPPL
ncbi:hypothetical protein SK128_001016 [Halocaridina rubra]|uniref:Fucosyltransferase n=1 Tax=Halocaridina rubra TaxID=373956 RepID=A0AAN8WQD2_HALRR